VIVDLHPWEYEWASHVGIRRFTERWTSLNAPWYQDSRMEDDRTAQVAAAITELAVAKHTNQYWGGHVWPANQHHLWSDMPDVGLNIEVRRVRSRRGAAVREKQLQRGLILWAGQPTPPEFRQVELWGWLDYDTAWAHGTESGFDPSVRYIDRDRLVAP